MSKVIAQLNPNLNQNQNLGTNVTVKNLIGNINSSLKQSLGPLSRVLQGLSALKTNTAYATGAVGTNVKLWMDRLTEFKNVIENGSKKTIQRLGPLDALSAPSADNTTATASYKLYDTQYEIFSKAILRAYNQMIQVQTMLKGPIDRKEDWASQYSGVLNDYGNLITLSRMMGLNVAPSTAPEAVTASVSRIAYPLTFQWRPTIKGADIKKWNTLATQVSAFKRAYPEYTFPQVLYHFTKDWDMFERYKFKNWYRWTQKTAEENIHMEKRAFQNDMITEDRLQKFTKKRKVLLSRIDLVRKALRDLMNNSLIDHASGSKMFKLLSMLEFEANGLKAPKLVAARVKRCGRQLNKLGFTEGSSALFAIANELLSPESLVKTAQEEAPIKPKEEKEVEKETKDKGKMHQTTDLLRRIKSQMDKLSYTKHLDELFYIKKELEKMGRDGDAESMLKIIRDDLDALDKLNKKLTDVYTNLSRLPVEMSMNEDKELAETKHHNKAQEMPIEVSEDEVSQKAAPSAPRPMKPTPVAPVAKPAAPVAPRIQTEIPNV